MKLFLIRHGETVHNVAQVWAGTTDSALTNHGMEQIKSLAEHLSWTTQLSNVFASDLSRARITAEVICRYQLGHPVTPVLSKDLREKDYGSLEGVSYASKSVKRRRSGSAEGETSSAYAEPESDESMKRRAISFLRQHLLPLLRGSQGDEKVVVAIVSHGIILRVLWRCLALHFHPLNIEAGPAMRSWDRDLNTLFTPSWSWSNTGFMSVLLGPRPQLLVQEPVELTENEKRIHAHLEVAVSRPGSKSKVPKPPPPTDALQVWSLTILAIDSKEHLVRLRRARGGIGSATYDPRQQSIDQFFG